MKKVNTSCGGGKPQEKYYIGKRQYVPDDSTLMCLIDNNDVFSSKARMIQKLYLSEKGTFFLIREESGKETTAKLLSEEEAFAFMDEHSAGIITESYDSIFGVPEKG